MLNITCLASNIANPSNFFWTNLSGSLKAPLTKKIKTLVPKVENMTIDNYKAQTNHSFRETVLLDYLSAVFGENYRNNLQASLDSFKIEHEEVYKLLLEIGAKSEWKILALFKGKVCESQKQELPIGLFDSLINSVMNEFSQYKGLHEAKNINLFWNRLLESISGIENIKNT